MMFCFCFFLSFHWYFLLCNSVSFDHNCLSVETISIDAVIMWYPSVYYNLTYYFLTAIVILKSNIYSGNFGD